MIMVRNANDISQIAEFSINNNNIRYFRANNEASIKTAGNYDILDNTFVSLYVNDGKYYLRVGNHDYLLDEIEIRHKNRLCRSNLIVTKKGRELANLNYKKNITLRDMLFSFFDFGWPIEAEDLDYGLFVFNVSQSPERQQIGKNQNSEL